MTFQTTENILTAHKLRRDALQDQINFVATKAFDNATFLQPSVGYWAAVDLLYSLNDEHFAGITQLWDIDTATLPNGTMTARETLIPRYATHDHLTVPDMTNQNVEIDNYVSDTHRFLNTMTTFQVYITRLSEVANRLAISADWLEKQDNFAKVQWVID